MEKVCPKCHKIHEDMKDKLIKNYINNLKIKDIKDFALKNDILINDNEADYLFNIVKNNYQELIYGNPNAIFKNIKDKINDDSYHKIIKLYFLYKNKYQHLL